MSGFYGSGKSSFTKYPRVGLGHQCADRWSPLFCSICKIASRSSQTWASFSTVAQRFPAAVLLLDLASEQVAGATMEEVSTVLYHKVLQWAGYSPESKSAAFERRLKKDGRYPEFLARSRPDRRGSGKTTRMTSSWWIA